MDQAAPTRLDPADRMLATETLVAAFASDPTWSWMFESAKDKTAALRGVIAPLLDGGIVNDSVWCTAGCESVAIWVPPGRPELTPELEAELDRSALASGEQVLERLDAVFGVFNAARAKAEPHHYLSMFGTLPHKQGTGLGGALLRACLAEIDAEAMPAYLESSNAANDPLYEKFGFVALELLKTPEGCSDDNSMWRAAR